MQLIIVASEKKWVLLSDILLLQLGYAIYELWSLGQDMWALTFPSSMECGKLPVALLYRFLRYVVEQLA